MLNPNGTLRWSIRLIDDERDDLNASPALGTDAVVIAGENGGVFSVPYDYCLRRGLQDSRCTVGGGERLPSDGVFLFYTTPFGRLLPRPPAEIDANQPIALSLFVREGGDTRVALLDSDHLQVHFTPDVAARVDVSGDRKFLTIIPKVPWAAPAGGEVAMRVEGDYLVDPERTGLRFRGGRVGGRFEQTFRFAVRARAAGAMPLPVPKSPGVPAGVWELYRLASPLPTILPSYNQIGFDSIHYLIGLVEGDATHAVGWAVGGRLAGSDNGSEVDPSSRVRFPLEIDYDGGLLTMTNEDGFTIEFNGFPLPFQLFRVATRVDDRGRALYSPAVDTMTTCDKIDFYGEFLQSLGYCNPTTDLLDVFGGANLRPHGDGIQEAPSGVGGARFETSYDRVTAILSGSQLRSAEHNIGLLVIDPKSGRPLPLSYMAGMAAESAPDGTLSSATLRFAPGAVRGEARVYLMVDAYPAAVATVRFPESVPLGVRVSESISGAWSSLKTFFGRLGREVALKIMRTLG